MKRSWGWIYGPTLVYMVLIFILSSIPTMQLPDFGFNIEDKIAHFLEYGVLGALLARSASFRRSFSFNLFLWIFLIGALYGASDEIHQAFVPNRFASVWDALVDMIGVAVGQAVYWKWKSNR